MSTPKMHDNEINIDQSMVERLIASQFPHWSSMPNERLNSSGTDNAMFRLGESMLVRFPRIPSAARQVEKEQKWLPLLAPHLPLTIPTPLEVGQPMDDFPWNWSVYNWIDGENATIDHLADPIQAAKEIASFVVAMQKIDSSDGPQPGEHNSFRGVPLADRDANVRKAVAELEGEIDGTAATRVWEVALRAPVWNKPPVWLHGDLQSGNILATHGEVNAVIDFGCLGIGDPACDLAVAWNLFSGCPRQAFRETLQPDDATWARGRGWALSIGLIALPYYKVTNPGLAKIARFAIDEVLIDRRA